MEVLLFYRYLSVYNLINNQKQVRNVDETQTASTILCTFSIYQTRIININTFLTNQSVKEHRNITQLPTT